MMMKIDQATIYDTFTHINEDLQLANQEHANHWSKQHENHHQKLGDNVLHVLQQHDQTLEKEAHPYNKMKIINMYQTL